MSDADLDERLATLDEKLDALLYYLDRRYSPTAKRTMTEKQWAIAFEADKKQFREVVKDLATTFAELVRRGMNV